jgi:transcription-repair coupling factor (superfamily II helicase)
VADKISIDFINEVLFEYEFKELILLQNLENFRFVGNCRCFRFRMIIRTESNFFGDEVESIRTFDVATQLSIETQKRRLRLSQC